MATTQALLAALSNMQSDIQQSLPVLPNNGNPGGVNNTSPSATVAPAQPAPAANNMNYSWLQPSASMTAVKDMLQKRGSGMGMSLAGMVNANSPPLVTQAPATVPNATAQQSVLPQYQSSAVLPHRVLQ